MREHNTVTEGRRGGVSGVAATGEKGDVESMCGGVGLWGAVRVVHGR